MYYICIDSAKYRMMKVVGRKEEVDLLQKNLKDTKSHLLAIIGRRRVGKTYLIREVYSENKVFEMTGLKDADLTSQLLNFNIQLNKYSTRRKKNEVVENWFLAFHQLTECLENQKSQKKQVIFFDEVPWIASKRSGFTEALAHWWNNWAGQQNIVVVLCGSATSWMIQHIVNAKGGLHNRITKSITLMPFTLRETQEFLESKHINLSNHQVVQLYLAIGGIPHYLDQIERGKSTNQNIQNLCFSKNGILRNEFENLYHALFENANNHIEIIKALASKKSGMDRQEILNKISLTDGGWFTNLLNELQLSGFISSFKPFKKKKKDTIFRLTDEYSLFYLKFIQNSNDANDEWLRISQTQEYKIWAGYAFENLCIKHIEEIKTALGISGIQSDLYSFLHRKNETYEKGFQIDLLIDRRDDIINLCEMKFYNDEFSINEEYASNLRTKIEGLKTVLKTKKIIQTIFISSYGILDNKYKLDFVDNDLRIAIFF